MAFKNSLVVSTTMCGICVPMNTPTVLILQVVVIMFNYSQLISYGCLVSLWCYEIKLINIVLNYSYDNY